MFLVSLPHTWPVQFSSSTERLAKFRWCIAKGRHLFPFRTEQLSLSAPMVLGGHPPGRVGRRRFFIEQTNPEPPAMAALRRSGPALSPPRRLSHFSALSAAFCERPGGRRRRDGTAPEGPAGGGSIGPAWSGSFGSGHAGWRPR